MLISSLMPVLR